VLEPLAPTLALLSFPTRRSSDLDLLQAVPRIAETMPGQFSSTAQDLARGKPTEIDHLNGFVVRKGDALGVPTPANRVLLALVKRSEEHTSELQSRVDLVCRLLLE